MASSKSITMQVVREVSFMAQMELQKPDQVVSVTLAPRAKKKVTWSADTVDSETCRHCQKKGAKKEHKKSSEKSRRGSPTRRYFKSLVNHLLA